MKQDSYYFSPPNSYSLLSSQHGSINSAPDTKAPIPPPHASCRTARPHELLHPGASLLLKNNSCRAKLIVIVVICSNALACLILSRGLLMVLSVLSLRWASNTLGGKESANGSSHQLQLYLGQQPKSCMQPNHFHPRAGTGPSTCTAGESTQDNDSVLSHLNSASLFREQPRSNTAFSGNRRVAEPWG